MSEHRLIYADELYDTLADKLTWLMNYGDEVYLEVGKDIREAINDQPTADVVEVVHGEWLVVAFNKIMCSECKHIWNIMNNDVETFEHCPKCGVVMDGNKVE